MFWGPQIVNIGCWTLSVHVASSPQQREDVYTTLAVSGLQINIHILPRACWYSTYQWPEPGYEANLKLFCTCSHISCKSISNLTHIYYWSRTTTFKQFHSSPYSFMQAPLSFNLQPASTNQNELYVTCGVSLQWAPSSPRCCPNPVVIEKHLQKNTGFDCHIGPQDKACYRSDLFSCMKVTPSSNIAFLVSNSLPTSTVVSYPPWRK